MASDAVQRIKERLSIVDVVSPYVELQQAGKNLKGKSPFTNERTPSFYVSPDRGMYYCFSSNQGGDIFTFIQKMEGVEFKEALRILAAKAGIELVAEDPRKKSERERLYDALEEATKFFENYRYQNPAALAYLTDRGVSQETIAKWRIGYAPGPPDHGWRELKAHMEGKGFTKDELLKAGLIKGAEAGKEPYDLFRDRIMFPICDPSGRVVAYSGRLLSKDSEAPKYVNSPETELYNKSETLFGYDKAKQGIRHLDFSLIVEGQFDVVLSHQAGYGNAVAVSGTALTEHHIMLLQRLSNRAVLALDADRAGIAAVKRAANLMLPRGMDIKVANMLGGKDPADMVREDVTKLRRIVGSAKPVIEYLLDILEQQKKDDRTLKLQVREELLPLVARIPNRIDQDHFITLIAERLATSKGAIAFELERLTTQEKPASGKEEPQAPSRAAGPAEGRRMRELDEYLTVFATVLSGGERTALERALAKLHGMDAQSAELAPETESRLVFEIEAFLAATPKRQQVEDLVDKLNELSALLLKDAVRRLNEELEKAEAEGDEAAALSSIGAIAALQRERGNLRFAPEDLNGD